mgnify:CR=1 FL=1
MNLFNLENVINKPTRVTGHSSTLLDPIIISDTEQIYHVKEGYLRKIPVERMLNFTSRKAREIHSQDWYFSQIPLNNMIYLFNYTEC